MEYFRTVLPNGVTVVVEPVPFFMTTSVGFWVPTGSRDEPAGRNGVAHMTEHMLFKGTSSRRARDIAYEMDEIGAQINGSTGKDFSGIYSTVPANWLPRLLDLMCDMFFQSVFVASELEREKMVVCEEIRTYEDSPDELAFDLLARALWGTSGLGLPTVGSVETVTGLDRSWVVEWARDNLAQDRLVVSVAGRADPDRVAAELESRLSRVPARTVPAAGSSVEAHSLSPAPGEGAGRLAEAARSVACEKDLEQVHVAIGTYGLPRTHRDRFALYVLDEILGAGMGSRLFQKLREEQGLVYTTHTYHAAFEETGLFAAYAATSPDNLTRVGEELLRELDRITQSPVSRQELERGIQQVKSDLIIGLETTAARMARLARLEMFYDRLYSPEEVIEMVEAVAIQDVCRAAQQVLQGSMACSVVGPRGGLTGAALWDNPRIWPLGAVVSRG